VLTVIGGPAVLVAVVIRVTVLAPELTM